MGNIYVYYMNYVHAGLIMTWFYSRKIENSPWNMAESIWNINIRQLTFLRFLSRCPRLFKILFTARLYTDLDKAIKISEPYW